MACVFLAALTTEHNETLDAEKQWFKCVTCGRWAHELCSNLDPVCVGLLDARTMTRLASVISFYTFCQRYSYTYMNSLEPTLPLCSSGRQIAL